MTDVSPVVELMARALARHYYVHVYRIHASKIGIEKLVEKNWRYGIAPVNEMLKDLADKDYLILDAAGNHYLEHINDGR